MFAKEKHKRKTNKRKICNSSFWGIRFEVTGSLKPGRYATVRIH